MEATSAPLTDATDAAIDKIIERVDFEATETIVDMLIASVKAIAADMEVSTVEASMLLTLRLLFLTKDLKGLIANGS
jgi:hypothetical protein